MSILIRPVAKRDLVAVRQQLVETWHATYDGIYGAEGVADITRRWHSLVRLAEQINDADGVFLLAEENGIVVASSFARIEKSTAKLYRLYVHPSAQCRHIGRRLLDDTFRRLPTANRHYLEVEPRNTRAIRFYEREGFTRTGEILEPDAPAIVSALVYERVPAPTVFPKEKGP